MNQITLAIAVFTCFAVIGTFGRAFSQLGGALAPLVGAVAKPGGAVAQSGGAVAKPGGAVAKPGSAVVQPVGAVAPSGSGAYPYKKFKDQTCERKWEKSQCVDTKTPFVRGEMLVYWRYDIEWISTRMPSFGRSFICACAAAAKKANSTYFGTHFWGECFSLRLDQVKAGTDCILTDGLYKTRCGKDTVKIKDYECLGNSSYYLYKLKETGLCTENNVDYYGNDIAGMEGISSWEACGAKCTQHNRCVSWSWLTRSYSIEADRGKCHLKSGSGGRKYKPNVISGTRGCVGNGPCAEKNIDYTGNDITAIKHIPSWQACGLKCKEMSTCVAWSWLTKLYSDENGRGICHLKTSTSGARYASEVISGTRDCVGNE